MPSEFSASAVPTKELIQALDRHGHVLLRGAISKDRTARYREALDQIYLDYDQVPDDFAAFAEAPEIAAGNVSPRIFAAKTGLRLEDYFAGRNTNALRDSAFSHPEPCLHTFMSVSLKPGHAQHGIRLHTDGIIQGTLDNVLTMWSPLHPCGVDAPGLQVVDASKERIATYLQRMFPDKSIPGWHSTTEWNSTGAFEPAAIEAEFGPAWAPAMEAGDVMIFSNWTIHGSYVLPHMAGRRSAAILRWREDRTPAWRRLLRKIRH